jgi:ABC-type branched-subunit amino acid transport system substrate-binding protein
MVANLTTGRDHDLVRAARIAVGELNAPGGIERVVRLQLFVRPASTPRAAAQATRSLAGRGVRAVILPCEPAAQAAAAVVTQRQRLVAIAPCNTLPGFWLRFRYAWPAALASNREAAALADETRDDGDKEVLVRGRGALVRYLRGALRNRGIALGAGGAVVLGPGTPDPWRTAIGYVRANRPVFATHAFESARAFRRYGDGLDGVRFTTFGFAEPGNDLDEFNVRYETLYGRRPNSSGAARGYDAVRLLAAAVDDADSTRPRDISAAIADGIDSHGALATLHYRAGQRNPKISVAVLQIEHGRETLVHHLDPSQVPRP